MTALGTCFPAPVSEKKVLKESSPAPMALSDGIFKGRNLINCQRRMIINHELLSASPGHQAGCRARGSRAPSRRYQSGPRPGRCGQRCTHAKMRSVINSVIINMGCLCMIPPLFLLSGQHSESWPDCQVQEPPDKIATIRNWRLEDLDILGCQL